MDWDDDATARVKNAPFVVRPLIRRRVEKYVRSFGRTRVTSADVSALKSKHKKEECAGDRDCSDCAKHMTHDQQPCQEEQK